MTWAGFRHGTRNRLCFSCHAGMKDVVLQAVAQIIHHMFLQGAPAKPDYGKVKEAIADMLDKEDYDDGSMGPVLVRLAWHASGTYDKNTKTGGSNGATMRCAPRQPTGRTSDQLQRSRRSWNSDACICLGPGSARAGMEQTPG